MQDLSDIPSSEQVFEFYSRCRDIYANSSKQDCDRRTEIYNVCVARWSKMLNKPRDTEPSTERINSDGSWRQTQIEDHFKPRSRNVSAFGSVIKKRKHKK